MTSFEIDLEQCRHRQKRLIDLLNSENLQGAVLTQNAHVQWLTGVYFPPVFSSGVHLNVDGKLTLIAPHKKPPVAAADEVERYDAKFHSTMRNDQNRACLEKLVETCGRCQAPLGVEGSSYGLHGHSLIGDNVKDIEPALYQLRRQKGPDELARIQFAIDATEKMYEEARRLIEPGVSEIDVYNRLQQTAIEFFDEPWTATGNDYQCASRGGPPRGGKTASAGDLYILDLGPAFRGYFADNARTIAVTQPSDLQLEAWGFIMKAFEHVEANVRPGKSCKELFNEVQAILDESPVGVFNHHLGHGIGLFPHEGPHLNPHWDDHFEVGDVFTAEPGLYDVEKLQAGMRIENDYVVTEDGVRKLTNFDLGLA